MKDGSLTSSGELDASLIGSQDSKERFHFSLEEATGGPALDSILTLLWNSGDAVTDGFLHCLVSSFGWQEGYHNKIMGSVLRPQARRGGRRGVQCVCFLNAVGLNSSSL